MNLPLRYRTHRNKFVQGCMHRVDGKRVPISRVVDPDPQGSVTFAGSVTRGTRIRVHFRKCIKKLTKTIKKGT
jgi:hypothetical protein